MTLCLTQIKAKHKEILGSEGLYWWKMAGPMFAQLPLWICLSLGMYALGYSSCAASALNNLGQLSVPRFVGRAYAGLA